MRLNLRYVMALPMGMVLQRGDGGESDAGEGGAVEQKA